MVAAVQTPPAGIQAIFKSPFDQEDDDEEENEPDLLTVESKSEALVGSAVVFRSELTIAIESEAHDDKADEEAEAPGRFFYETVPLPPALTKGKTSVAVKVVARGHWWVYGQTFDKFQKPFTKESRGLYGFYTHTDGYFVPPVTEKKGEMPKATMRPSPGEEVIEKSKASVIGRVKALLDSGVKPTTNNKSFESGLFALGEAYNVPWTPAFHNAKAIERIVQIGDLEAIAFLRNPRPRYGRWSGAGPLGWAIQRTWPEIGKRMNEKARFGDRILERREAWSRMLKSSIDYWRTHRRSYTNQSMIVDEGIYTANRGLLLIDPPAALPELHWGPFLGKAAFYWLQYGDYLIGMNTTETRCYTLHVPPGCARALDLVITPGD